MRERKDGCCNEKFQYPMCGETVSGTLMSQTQEQKENFKADGEIQRINEFSSRKYCKVVYFQQQNEDVNMIEYSQHTATSSRSKRPMKQTKLTESNNNLSRSNSSRDVKVDIIPITEENDDLDSNSNGSVNFGYLRSINSFFFGCNICTILSNFSQRILHYVFNIA